MGNANLEGIEFSVKSSAGSAKNSIDKLVKSLERLKEASSSMESFSKEMKNLDDSLKQISSGSTGKLERLGKALSGFKVSKTISENLATFSSSISSIASAVDKINDSQVSKLERMSNAMSSINLSSRTAKSLSAIGDISTTTKMDVNTTPKEFVNQPMESEAVDKSAKLERLSNVAKSASNVFKACASSFMQLNRAVGKIALSGAEIGFKHIKKPIAEIVNKAREATHAFDGFFGALKRIILYRGIRSVIAGITNSLKSGITNLYYYSLTADKVFSSAMDRISTSYNYMRNSLAAAFAPLIERVAPIVDVVIDKFVDLLNIINQVFAKLNGENTYTKAIKYSYSYSDLLGDSAEDATKKVKELKKTVLGFDELNKLQDNTEDKKKDSSNTPNYSKMFTTGKVDSSIGNLVKRIKKYFTEGNWKGLGKLIGRKFNELIDSINWKKIGKKFGKFINAFFTTKYWALKTADFKKLGSHLASAVTSALKAINWDTVGRSLARSKTAFFDLVTGFLGNVDWKTVGNSIGNFIKGFCDEMSEWIESNDSFDGGKKTVASIFETVGAFKDTGVGKAIWKFLANSMCAVIDFAAGVVYEALRSGVSKALGKDLSLDKEIAKKVNATDFELMFNVTGLKNGAKDSTSKSIINSTLKGGTVSLKSSLSIHSASSGIKHGGKGFSFANSIINGTSIKTKSQVTIGSLKDDGSTSSKNFIKNLLPVIGKKTGVTIHISSSGTPHGGGGGTFEKGGIFKGGSWSSIPQYANGGVTHGSLFVAGERGSEVVGHINGQTEVLNQSQLAAVMKSSVLSGMSVLASQMAQCTNALISQNLRSDSSTDIEKNLNATERQNRLLEEQNRLLRSIADKDTSTHITAGMISSAMNEKNRRSGKVAIVY